MTVKNWIKTGATYAHAYVGRVIATLAIAGLFLIPYCMAIAATLLPNGQQVFLDNNGVPLSGGKVYFYFPATTTFKTTWQDSAQSITNTNPVILDGAGRATVYGAGVYRQQVFDSLGNLIWDKNSTDTSASNSVFWAGQAAGTPNAITIVDPGFNATDGTVINFTAVATNTGPATLNPSAFGAVPIEKDTTGGPIALIGSEIIANNPISVIYRASDAAFHLLNTVIESASGANGPLCSTTGLVINNNNATPSTIITITANGAVMANSGGLVVTRTGSITTTINITLGTVTSTAGGMDGEASGVSSWLYLWLIDNGSSTSAIASKATGFGLVPHLPSGYSYICRIGAMLTDGSNNLFRTVQRGQVAQYLITTGSNTTVPPNIINGNSGTYSTTDPVLTSVDISTLVPPTATAVQGVVTGSFKGRTAANVLAAPGTSWGGTGNGPLGTSNTGFPIWITTASPSTAMFNWNIQFPASQRIGYASDTVAGGGAVSIMGWTDSVTAN